VGLGSIGNRFKGGFFGSGKDANSPNEPGAQSDGKKGSMTDRYGNRATSAAAAASAKSDSKNKPQTMKISKVLA